MVIRKSGILNFDSITSKDMMFDIATIVDRVDIIPLNDESLMLLSDTMAELYLNDYVDISDCVINILKSVYSKNKIFNLPFKCSKFIMIINTLDECNEELNIECDLECQIKKVTELLTVNTLEEFHAEFIKLKQNIGDRDLHEDIVNHINKLHDAFNKMVELTHV